MTPAFKPVGTAVLGCGRVSDAHLEAICEDNGYGRLEAVIDTDRDRAELSARRYNAPRALRTLEEALNVPAIEAIVVCLPNHLHVEPTVAALQAGRHVLVEKPMAPARIASVASARIWRMSSSVAGSRFAPRSPMT